MIVSEDLWFLRRCDLLILLAQKYVLIRSFGSPVVKFTTVICAVQGTS